MTRKLLLALVVLAFARSQVAQAQSAQKKIAINGLFGKSQLKVYALANGAKFTGTGTLSAGNNSGRVYTLTVKSGAFQGRYVRLEGQLASPTGVAFTSFILYGETMTGTIRLSYTGSNNTPVVQTTKGTVIVQ